MEDWDYQWFDGRDKLHIRVKATEDNTQFRGVGFYSKGNSNKYVIYNAFIIR